MFDRLLYHDDTEPRSAALNMAIDEALLEHSATPALRSYSWNRPALSFGYFGRLADAIESGNGRELVRRWTGGGIVLHGADLTYSLILPTVSKHDLFSSREVYRQVHQAIQDILMEIGIEATLASSASPRVSEACFSNPVFADVLLGGSKVAGAAQRRTKTGLLQQGSIQYLEIPSDFGARLARKLCHSARSTSIDPEVIERAQALADHKYATREWLERR